MTQVSTKISQQLMKFAQRFQDNPNYMAFAVSQYQQQERLSDSQLVEFLGISEEVLSRLLLCKCPSANAADFADQVRKIALYVGIDATKLAYIIRQIDFLKQLSAHSQLEQVRFAKEFPRPAFRGITVAARDRVEDSSEEILNPDQEKDNDTSISED